jgi:hypothetical protein
MLYMILCMLVGGGVTYWTKARGRNGFMAYIAGIGAVLAFSILLVFAHVTATGEPFGSVWPLVLPVLLGPPLGLVGGMVTSSRKSLQ